MALSELRYPSRALGKQTSALVLLPDPGFKDRLPVFYLLHGLSDDHTIWLRRTRIESYIEQHPCIVVMPDGAKGFYADDPHGNAFRTAVAVELVDYVDAMFPTRARRGARGIGGLSMGGYGALKLGLLYPERFGSVTAHSSATDFAHGEGWMRNREFGHLLDGRDKGGAEDLYRAASALAKSGRRAPAIHMDCGTEDELLAMNRRFSAHLKRCGIAHGYAEHPGGHEWDYWDLHIREALAFHAGVWKRDRQDDRRTRVTRR